MPVTFSSRASVLVGSVLVLLSIDPATPAAAHDAKDPRHIAMESLSDNMKALGRMQRGGISVDDAKPLAAAIAEVGERMPALFGTRNPGHDNNRAKPDIWDDWTGFTTQIDRFRDATAGLVAAIEAGDANAAGTALNAVGQTCVGCHRPYRAPRR